MLKQLPRTAFAAIGFPALATPATNQLLAMLYELEVSQWMAPEELEQRQMEQVGRVLHHAYNTVPYYRQLFDQHGIVPNAIPDRDYLARIPISRRQMFQADPQALHTRSLPPQHGAAHPISTSGSTGVPVKLLGTDVTRFFWRAMLMRDHAWHDRDFSRKLGVIRWAAPDVARMPHGLQLPHWPIIDEYFESGPCAMLNVATPLAEQISWLQALQPHYLLSFPSNLAALARHCLLHGVTLPGLGQLRTIGEMVTPDQRALFRQAWGVGAVDVYSCEEAGYLALQCPNHDHYHVQSENVLLEVVDDDGQPCAPGKPGRVLITSLHNFATPLIRYELGDYAEVGEACPCGRGLPVLAAINGRRRNRLILPDGRSEFPYLGEHGQIQALTGVEVRQIQFVQHTIEEVEVRLVASRPFSADEEEKVAQRVRCNLGHPFRVRISIWDSLPKGPTGKFDEFVSLVEV